MIRVSRLVLRRYGLEAEFTSAVALLMWAGIVYFTAVDMMERPSLSLMARLSDPEWAMLTGAMGAAQLACVVLQTRLGRWLIAFPVASFWVCISATIAYSSIFEHEPTPPSLALYGALALSMLFKVSGPPREFPPHG